MIDSAKKVGILWFSLFDELLLVRSDVKGWPLAGTHFIMLNPRAGKIKPILCFPSGQDGPILPARDLPRRSRKTRSLFGHLTNSLLP